MRSRKPYDVWVAQYFRAENSRGHGIPKTAPGDAWFAGGRVAAVIRIFLVKPTTGPRLAFGPERVTLKVPLFKDFTRTVGKRFSPAGGLEESSEKFFILCGAWAGSQEKGFVI